MKLKIRLLSTFMTYVFVCIFFVMIYVFVCIFLRTSLKMPVHVVSSLALFVKNASLR
jgi:hypothetical protein